jgi:hypothetical protein
VDIKSRSNKISKSSKKYVLFLNKCIKTNSTLDYEVNTKLETSEVKFLRGDFRAFSAD